MAKANAAKPNVKAQEQKSKNPNSKCSLGSTNVLNYGSIISAICG